MIKPQVTKNPPLCKSMVHTECPECKSLVWTLWTNHKTGKQFCEFCAPPGTRCKSLLELNEDRKKADEKRKRRKKVKK
jgi:uncharacterized Zn finger protein (UPF0148 family)